MSGCRRLLAACGVGAVLCLSNGARAQSESESGEDARPDAVQRMSLVGRFSVARVERWLASEDPDERQRAIERLGELGTPAALARLGSHAFERRSQLGGRETVLLARALAPHAADAKVQLVLAMLLNQSPAKAAGPDEVALTELGRGTAALALADDGSASSLLVLGRALRTQGAPAALAADALGAHPPESLAPLLEAPGEPTVALARLLGALGDQRAFHVLRDWVRGEPAEVRAAAALALTRLGHMETVPLGALWLGEGPAELRGAGLEILLASQDPRAEPVLGAWLGSGQLDDRERRMLLEYPSPGLATALLARAPGDAAERRFRSTLLGRIGGKAAAEALGRELGAGESVFAAAHALSRMPGKAAHDVLESALGEGVAPALVLRAAAARTRAFQEHFGALDERIALSAPSADAGERAAAAWARALGGGPLGLAELRSDDEERVLAAASTALGFDDGLVDAALDALSRRPPGRARTALAACLVWPRARDRATSPLLWSLVAEGGAARPLALRALAARNDPGLWAGLGSYLDNADARLREHVARGLGESDRPEAVGHLASRFAFETDEGVRRAIVIALAAHRGPAASRWLDRAARLDPSARVRSAAQLARGGVVLGDAEQGSEVLWVELRDGAREAPPIAAGTAPSAEGPSAAGPAPAPAALGSAALLGVAPGLAMPVFADPAGFILVVGLPASHLGIRLQ